MTDGSAHYWNRLVMEHLIQQLRETYADLPDNPLDIQQWLPEGEEWP